MITIKNMRQGRPSNPWDVRIDRFDKILGNPFYMNSENERNLVCDKYEIWFNENLPKLLPRLNQLNELYQKYGKLNLYCWCAPKRCHAETIKRWLELN
jgi:hypothetical protein